jgi:hypothetical protein
MMDQKSMMGLKSNVLLLYMAIYISVSVFAAAMLLLDTWPKPPTSPVDWILLLSLVPAAATSPRLANPLRRGSA